MTVDLTKQSWAAEGKFIFTWLQYTYPASIGPLMDIYLEVARSLHHAVSISVFA